MIARYTANGKPDASFGNGGSLTMQLGTDSAADAVAQQADGMLLVSGMSEASGQHYATVVRLTASGAIDTSFGTQGIATTAGWAGTSEARALTIQADGKIVIVGSGAGGTQSVVARFTTTGALDTTFNTVGVVLKDVVSGGLEQLEAVTIDGNGRIVVAGEGKFDGGQALIGRYTSNGSFDATFFNGNFRGIAFGTGTSTARSLVVDPAGTITLAGYASNAAGAHGIGVVRLNSNATGYDTTFGTSGYTFIDTSSSADSTSIVDMIRQSNGKYALVAASAPSHNTATLARLTNAGTLDTSFATNGRTTLDLASGTTPAAIVQQPDGRLVVASSSTAADGSTMLATSRFLSESTDVAAYESAFGNLVVACQDTADCSDTHVAAAVQKFQLIDPDYDVSSYTSIENHVARKMLALAPVQLLYGMNSTDGRLQSIDDRRASTSSAIAYDARGNESGRTITKSGGQVDHITYGFDSRNRLATYIEDQSAKSINLTYDIAGHLTRAAGSDTSGDATYRYDLENHLVQEDIGSTRLQFNYNPTGIEGVTITSAGQSARYYYYEFDRHGDVVRMIDDAGTAVVTYHYDVWGNQRAEGDQTLIDLNPAAYAGQSGAIYVARLRMYSMGERWYDPYQSRFLSPDPAGIDPTKPANLYAYAYNDPIDNIDETGRTAHPNNTLTSVQPVVLTVPDPGPPSFKYTSDPYANVPRTPDMPTPLGAGSFGGKPDDATPLEKRPAWTYLVGYAQNYATLWYDGHNGAYTYYKGGNEDCTNFVSQILYNGFEPMIGNSNGATSIGADGDTSKWFYKSVHLWDHNLSTSWSAAPDFHTFILRNRATKSTKESRQAGDIIMLTDNNGKWVHTAWLGHGDDVYQHAGSTTNKVSLDEWIGRAHDQHRHYHFLHTNFKGMSDFA